MDISTFFMGSGFALFIALLAWGNKIREPRQDIRELEDKFVKSFETDRRDIKPLITNSYESIKGHLIEGFSDTMDALVEIMDKIERKEDIALIKKFKDLDKLRKRLEKFYKMRYLFSLIFTFILFLLGIFSEANGNETFIGGRVYNQFYLCIFIIFVFIILITISSIYFLEEEFIVGVDETRSLMKV